MPAGWRQVVPSASTGRPPRADIEGLYRDALEQNPNDKPFAIFLDVNLPPDPNRRGLDKEWIQDLKATLDRFPSPTPVNPDPHALLCVTNLGGYWEENEIANPPEVVVILSRYAAFPLKDASLFGAFAWHTRSVRLRRRGMTWSCSQGRASVWFTHPVASIPGASRGRLRGNGPKPALDRAPR
jgi:hypothetical protein